MVVVSHNHLELLLLRESFIQKVELLFRVEPGGDQEIEMGTAAGDYASGIAVLEFFQTLGPDGYFALEVVAHEHNLLHCAGIGHLLDVGPLHFLRIG